MSARKDTKTKAPLDPRQKGLFAFGFTKTESPPKLNFDQSIDEDEEIVEIKELVTVSSSGCKRTAAIQPEKVDVSGENHSTSLETTKIKTQQVPPAIVEKIVEKKEIEPVASKFLSSSKTIEVPVSKPIITKEDETTTSAKKRKKIVLDSESELSDGEDEISSKKEPEIGDKRKSSANGATSKTPQSKKKPQKLVSESESDSEDEEDDSEEEEEEDEEPVAASKKRKTPSKGGVKVDVSKEMKAGVLTLGNHEHNFLTWFQNRKDSSMRTPDHPQYDPSTLFVPPGYLTGQESFHVKGKARKITDGMRTWWDFYSRNSDCILAFKVGKFYELYHRCADIAVSCCDLLYMRGDTAHCGFPEQAWSKFMSKLIAANHRVARVEQTETPADAKLRTGKSSCAVRREICQVLSPGTMTLSVRDCGEGYIPRTDGRNQLLALFEQENKVGVCLLDASTGKFRIGEFENDEHRVGLRACFAFEIPAEIVYVKGNLSQETLNVLKYENKALHTILPAGASTPNDFVSPYFTSSLEVPDLLKNLTPLSTNVLYQALRVLKRALVDDELMTMGQFSSYYCTAKISTENNNSGSEMDVETETSSQKGFLRLDAQALRHLEIVANATDGSKKGSLLEYLDRTRSPFGARMFREWVTKPLTSVPQILERQRAVNCLIPKLNDSATTEFRKVLNSCPDLERNLSKIHAMSLPRKAKNHPESRAVIFCAEDVNKSKIENFCTSLEALHRLRVVGGKVFKQFEGDEETEQYLQNILKDLNSETCLKILEHFEQAFDAKQAKKSGTIEPRPGVAENYDASYEAVSSAKNELNTYLNRTKKEINCSGLQFFSPQTGKLRYQIEVPEARQVPESWTMVSKRKGFKRYSNPEVKKLIAQLERAEANHAEASIDVTRLVFAEFDKHKSEWIKLVQAASMLDCLLALTLVSTETETCLPEFVTNEPKPRLELIQARHPCVAAGLDRLGKNSFIPNDTTLNTENGSCMLLTGPNMGGKSTLLRQTCLATIVAQIGCRVQASSYRGTIVDAIFTRVGASDRILEGQSTFFVELSETATILKSASRHSLVILDELGRGTSTFDGTAIAHAVVEKLVDIGCLTMFATHYHSLVKEVGRLPGVSLGHMACVAEQSGEKQDVTFLYKLESGASDRSYGLNVARLARLPEEIIKRAHEMSQKFECAFEYHLRNRLLEDIKEYSGKRDAKRLRSSIERIDIFLQ